MISEKPEWLWLFSFVTRQWDWGTERPRKGTHFYAQLNLLVPTICFCSNSNRESRKETIINPIKPIDRCKAMLCLSNLCLHNITTMYSHVQRLRPVDCAIPIRNGWGWWWLNLNYIMFHCINNNLSHLIIQWLMILDKSTTIQLISLRWPGWRSRGLGSGSSSTRLTVSNTKQEITKTPFHYNQHISI